MSIIIMGIKSAKTKRSCQNAGGVWRKGVRGVRRGSCARKGRR